MPGIAYKRIMVSRLGGKTASPGWAPPMVSRGDALLLRRHHFEVWFRRTHGKPVSQAYPDVALSLVMGLYATEFDAHEAPVPEDVVLVTVHDPDMTGCGCRAKVGV